MSSKANDLALRLRGVSVEVEGKTLLGPLDLDVATGEHVLVVGRSGSGKTTLLRAIAGLAPLQAGTVEIAGREAAEGPRELLAPAERSIGMLFQGGALWPHMTAKKTLEFVLERAGVPRGERSGRIAELLEAVGLSGYEKRKPAELSGGEAQRLALARALAGSPKLLLLDEPLGPLDAELRSSMLDLLRGLVRGGLTLLHVTHDPDEATRGDDSTRLIRLEKGRIAPPLDPAPTTP